MTSAIKIEEDPSFQNNSSCADEKELESTFNTISPIHSKLHTSIRNVVNITKATWQKIGRFYSLCKKPSIPFICFMLGYVEKNYLIDQGSFNQYSLTIKVDNATECAITNLLESCHEKGALFPLSTNPHSNAVSNMIRHLMRLPGRHIMERWPLFLTFLMPETLLVTLLRTFASFQFSRLPL